MTDKRVALYLRVSRDGQTVENQRAELQAAAARNGWRIVAEFADEGISGAKGRDQRPSFDALCRGMARKDFDLVAAWAVDRLGRSLQHLVSFLSDLQRTGCDLYLHKQNLDTTTPAGRALFGMLAIFGEFEREMIRERVAAGIARARREGKALGFANPARADQRDACQRGGAATREAARQRAAAVLPIIASIKRAGVTSLEGVAEALTARGVPTARPGARWHASSVRNVLALSRGGSAA